MRKLLVAALAALTVLGVAGTASAGSPAKVAPPPVTLHGKVNNKGTTTAVGNKVGIVQNDYSYKPTFIQATPGTTLTITLKNDGRHEHTFTTVDGTVNKKLKPGKKATIQVAVPASGDGFVFYCRFHGPHGTAGDFGMQGAIYTRPGATLAGVPKPKSKKKATSTTSGGYGY